LAVKALRVHPTTHTHRLTLGGGFGMFARRYRRELGHALSPRLRLDVSHLRALMDGGPDELVPPHGPGLEPSTSAAARAASPSGCHRPGPAPSGSTCRPSRCARPLVEGRLTGPTRRVSRRSTADLSETPWPTVDDRSIGPASAIDDRVCRSRPSRRARRGSECSSSGFVSQASDTWRVGHRSPVRGTVRA
jgi:hypothetical protein